MIDHGFLAGRPDVVLLEGWMLGFSPLLDEAGSIGLGVDIFKKYPSLTVLHVKFIQCSILTSYLP